jgi:hypothetical protein
MEINKDEEAIIKTIITFLINHKLDIEVIAVVVFALVCYYFIF